jgi:hypothetical protein
MLSSKGGATNWRRNRTWLLAFALLPAFYVNVKHGDVAVADILFQA